ncbi:MAG TPA: glycosyltransferase family 2 protein [Nanoarchaeota archaeon]|nr:MAG: glycosyl transferase family protein [archaeon GW2011_AR6]HIH17782.1 glycosyltransferase family 2 protein [Nanoarchaeota archaeon]HIH34036.1 glycosyltransferase family 2 protein [Nanoarchaeota archaeon]HIH51650.1 glycosyltransferase family 2 protein [Nanoarchaeota archaeon]
MKPEVSIVLPFYNEEGNVRKVLQDLSSEFGKSKIDYEIIAVNNGSWDKTPGIISDVKKKNKRVKRVDVKKNQGYGFGILTGLKSAQGKYIGYGWGDGQVLASDFVKVFQTLKESKVDICKVRRVTRESEGFSRNFRSKGYNLLISSLFFMNLKDINGCPKIMKEEVYRNLNLQSRDWFLDPELIIKAKRKGYKILEVPIIFKKRERGKSNVGFIKTDFEFLKNIIKYRLGVK